MQVEEVFVEIEGYPNYAVSNYGTVVNAKHNRDLKPWVHSKNVGKLIVKLSRNGVAKNFFVHRLVAQAFFVNYGEEVDVRHISGDYSDNCVTNLHLVERDG